MTIEQINETKKGCFKAIIDDLEVGKLIYTRSGNDKFIIVNTEVNPSFKGQNIVTKMILAAVEYTRENNLKIIPFCSFAKSIFEKNKEIQDVLLQK